MEMASLQSLFSNRRYSLKLVGAAALLGLTFWDFGTRGWLITPAFWFLQRQGNRWEGAALWVPTGIVTAVEPNRFEIEDRGHRIWVRPSHPEAQIGRHLTLSVVIHFEEEAWLELKDVRVLRNIPGGRSLLTILSLAVLGVLLLKFRRWFAPLPRRALYWSSPRG
jgi:hypothetical protein